MKLHITGVTGFVGNALMEKAIHKQGCMVFGSSRTKKAINFRGEAYFQKEIDPETYWEKDLADIDTVIHTAAYTHIEDISPSSIEQLKRVNTFGTLNLAKQAAKVGVKRFVFVSSSKVNGESTLPNNSFKEYGSYIPDDHYALSKYEAEQGLLDIAKETEMEVVIIRPPLVYGPGVKANFAVIVKLVNSGLPLPFGLIKNKRSLIAIENLVDFIMLCADKENSPRAANQIFLISDDEDVSTTELLRKVAKSLNKRQWLIPVPLPLIRGVAKLFGKMDKVDKVIGNLQIDCSKAKALLGWKPRVTMNEQLIKMQKSRK